MYITVGRPALTDDPKRTTPGGGGRRQHFRRLQRGRQTRVNILQDSERPSSYLYLGHFICLRSRTLCRVIGPARFSLAAGSPCYPKRVCVSWQYATHITHANRPHGCLLVCPVSVKRITGRHAGPSAVRRAPVELIWRWTLGLASPAAAFSPQRGSKFLADFCRGEASGTVCCRTSS